MSCPAPLPIVIPPVLVSVTSPPIAVTPSTVAGKHPTAVIVPTVKPPTSVNSMLPSVVEIAANVPVIWLFALSRSMLFLALTPRLAAVMSPIAV